MIRVAPSVDVSNSSATIYTTDAKGYRADPDRRLARRGADGQDWFCYGSLPGWAARVAREGDV